MRPPTVIRLLFAGVCSLAAICHAHSLQTSLGIQHPLLLESTYSPNELTLLAHISNDSIAEWSAYYTHSPHLAGTNRSMAEWTALRWATYNWSTQILEYPVYLNYPLSSSLALSFGNGTALPLELQEDCLSSDPTTCHPDRIPAFHGYSFSGSVAAEYVYVGQGGRAEFLRLRELGIPLAGKIALAQYGGIFRGAKLRNAQEFGMVGLLTFSDPGGDGKYTEKNGYRPYPVGPARNPSSVQRGSAMFMHVYPGDPQTPGYASKPGCERTEGEEVLPRIPSLPLSARAAEPLLRALEGAGASADQVGNMENWKGGLDAGYWTGPAVEVNVSMSNIMRDRVVPIWNVVGVINGTIEDEVVILGNHRDAWIVGGAGDANSGSAIFIELAKAFRELQKTGWKPLRTIVLASWDGEEYGLVGSTEFVEDYAAYTRTKVLAYINVDVASGPLLAPDTLPSLRDLLTRILKKIPSADRNSPNGTLYDAWSTKRYGLLGSGSDFAAFLHQGGVASVDFRSWYGNTTPVWHAHSNYDSPAWMARYGDPGFWWHVACARFLALLALELVDSPIVPVNASAYAEALREHLGVLETKVWREMPMLRLGELREAVGVFTEKAQIIEAWKPRAEMGRVFVINKKLMGIDRALTAREGPLGKEFYRHVVYAPGSYTGYAAVTFPGITEAVDAGNLSLASEWVDRTAAAVRAAARGLEMPHV